MFYKSDKQQMSVGIFCGKLILKKHKRDRETKAFQNVNNEFDFKLKTKCKLCSGKTIFSSVLISGLDFF